MSVPRYVIVGLSNTVLSLVVIWKCLPLGDIAANVMGYLAGFAWSFVLNRWWTFRRRGSVVRFGLVCAVAYGVNLVVLLAARPRLPSMAAQFAAVIAYTIVGYLGSRFYAFTGR